jgi:hypothetical protein
MSFLAIFFFIFRGGGGRGREQWCSIASERSRKTMEEYVGMRGMVIREAELKRTSKKNEDLCLFVNQT